MGMTDGKDIIEGNFDSAIIVSSHSGKGEASLHKLQYKK